MEKTSGEWTLEEVGGACEAMGRGEVSGARWLREVLQHAHGEDVFSGMDVYGSVVESAVSAMESGGVEVCHEACWVLAELSVSLDGCEAVCGAVGPLVRMVERGEGEVELRGAAEMAAVALGNVCVDAEAQSVLLEKGALGAASMLASGKPRSMAAAMLFVIQHLARDGPVPLEDLVTSGAVRGAIKWVNVKSEEEVQDLIRKAASDDPGACPPIEALWVLAYASARRVGEEEYGKLIEEIKETECFLAVVHIATGCAEVMADAEIEVGSVSDTCGRILLACLRLLVNLCSDAGGVEFSSQLVSSPFPRLVHLILSGNLTAKLANIGAFAPTATAVELLRLVGNWLYPPGPVGSFAIEAHRAGIITDVVSVLNESSAVGGDALVALVHASFARDEPPDESAILPHPGPLFDTLSSDETILRAAIRQVTNQDLGISGSAVTFLHALLAKSEDNPDIPKHLEELGALESLQQLETALEPAPIGSHGHRLRQVVSDIAETYFYGE